MTVSTVRFMMAMIFVGCVVVGLLCIQDHSIQGKNQSIPQVATQLESPVDLTENLILQQQLADDRISQCLGEYQNDLRDLRNAACKKVGKEIQSRKVGIKLLAADLLGWKSKGILLWSIVPWTNHNAHREFVRAKFTEHLIDEEYIQNLIKRTLREHERELMDLRNEMLINLRIDLQDYGMILPESQTGITIEHQMRSFVRQVELPSLHSGTKDVLLLALSFKMAQPLAEKLAEVIMTRLASVLATRLTTSGVVLGTGAAGSWPTLGLSIVIAIAIDSALEWIVSWFSDPETELQNQLSLLVDEISNSLLTDNEEQGLSRLMQRYDELHLKALSSSLRESLLMSSPVR